MEYTIAKVAKAKQTHDHLSGWKDEYHHNIYIYILYIYIYINVYHNHKECVVIMINIQLGYR